MKTAKLFKNGQSQAVRLPREFRFRGDSVFIQKFGDCVVLLPKDEPWKGLLEAAQLFTPDFMMERNQGAQADREGWA